MQANALVPVVQASPDEATATAWADFAQRVTARRRPGAVDAVLSLSGAAGPTPLESESAAAGAPAAAPRPAEAPGTGRSFKSPARPHDERPRGAEANLRIALAVEGTRGDVQPMCVLGARLAAAGHDVRICAPPDFRDAAQASGLDFRPVGADVRSYLTRNAASVDGSTHRILRESFRYCLDGARRQFESLPEATAEVDALIGAGVQLAAPSAAELHGIPYRYVAYCPGILPSSEHGPMPLPFQTLPAFVNRFAWGMTRGFFASVVRPWINSHRRALGLAPVSDAVSHLLTGRIVIAADAGLASLPADAGLGARQMPALLPFPGAELPEELASFLEAGPAPVYFGFGSMPDADPQRTTAILLGAICAVGCRAVVSKGWANLGGLPLPEGVIEIDSVCHARLFPRMAAVVHHGGAGTTTAAARAGVPQVIVPHVFDQFYWARRIELLGLGPPALPRKRLRVEALADALRTVLEQEIVAERAREIGERLRSEAERADVAGALGLEAAAPPLRNRTRP